MYRNRDDRFWPFSASREGQRSTQCGLAVAELEKVSSNGEPTARSSPARATTSRVSSLPGRWVPRAFSGADAANRHTLIRRKIEGMAQKSPKKALCDECLPFDGSEHGTNGFFRLEVSIQKLP